MRVVLDALRNGGNMFWREAEGQIEGTDDFLRKFSADADGEGNTVNDRSFSALCLVETRIQRSFC